RWRRQSATRTPRGRTKMRRIVAMLAMGLSLCAPALLEASTITFELNYSGASFGNSATAVGTISFDDTALPNVATAIANASSADLGVTAFSITVSGASAGNGTFGLADVTNWVWVLTDSLNFSQNLVGQAGFEDFNWCASGFDPCTPPAPGGIDIFTISTNAETGDSLLLTSMQALSVPEPATLLLLAAALTGIGAGRARRRRSVRS